MWVFLGISWKTARSYVIICCFLVSPTELFQSTQIICFVRVELINTSSSAASFSANKRISMFTKLSLICMMCNIHTHLVNEGKNCLNSAAYAPIFQLLFLTCNLWYADTILEQKGNTLHVSKSLWATFEAQYNLETVVIKHERFHGKRKLKKKKIGRLSLASYVLEISKCNVAQRAEPCCSPQKSGERRRGFSFPTRLISPWKLPCQGDLNHDKL